ncbi:hypothetical protein GCM10008916_08900 [Clostridium nitritogenes]|uniref:Uncharacterized protein n=1 Tax=Clostridium nitritogenes TaxID=83340 RepID=A0ABN1LJV3_9CLOT
MIKFEELNKKSLFYKLLIKINAIKQALLLKLIFSYYSHSIVAGGLEVISYTILLTPLTSLTILLYPFIYHNLLTYKI